jgi:ribonuclease P/MRP protein subunit POP5
LLKRIRCRYLALEIDGDGLFDSRDFIDAVWSAVSKLYGEHGASHAGLTLIDYDMEKKFAVIRTAHTAVDMVRTALASMTRIENKPVAIHILTVSGTMKSLYTKTKK